MDTVNCCLVGYGGIAEYHARALQQIEGVGLRTLVGRRAEPAEAFQQKMGFEGVTTCYEDALEDPSIKTNPVRMKQEKLLELVEWIKQRK